MNKQSVAHWIFLVGLLWLLATPVWGGYAPISTNLTGTLFRCEEVTMPGPLDGCGNDPLTQGKIQFSRHGNVHVKLVGALPNAQYDVFVAVGSVVQFIGSFWTNTAGQGILRLGPAVFPQGAVGAGTVVISRDGVVQYLLGFKVTAPFIKP